jgi:hypothetical protein
LTVVLLLGEYISALMECNSDIRAASLIESTRLGQADDVLWRQANSSAAPLPARSTQKDAPSTKRSTILRIHTH